MSYKSDFSLKLQLLYHNHTAAHNASPSYRQPYPQHLILLRPKMYLNRMYFLYFLYCPHFLYLFHSQLQLLRKSAVLPSLSLPELPCGPRSSEKFLPAAPAPEPAVHPRKSRRQLQLLLPLPLQHLLQCGNFVFFVSDGFASPYGQLFALHKPYYHHRKSPHPHCPQAGVLPLPASSPLYLLSGLFLLYSLVLLRQIFPAFFLHFPLCPVQLLLNLLLYFLLYLLLCFPLYPLQLPLYFLKFLPYLFPLKVSPLYFQSQASFRS